MLTSSTKYTNQWKLSTIYRKINANQVQYIHINANWRYKTVKILNNISVEEIIMTTTLWQEANPNADTVCGEYKLTGFIIHLKKTLSLESIQKPRDGFLQCPFTVGAHNKFTFLFYLSEYLWQQNEVKALPAQFTRCIYFVATKNWKSTQSTKAKTKNCNLQKQTTDNWYV